MLSPRVAALVVVGLAFFTDTLLYAMLPPLLPIYERELGLSQMRLGLLFASYAGALLLSTLPLGRLTDRTGRKGPFLAGLVGLAATTVLFAFARSFPALLLARALQGVAAAATWAAGLAVLADRFPSDQRGKAMSTVFACANVGLLTGPLLSGAMAERWGPRAPFLAAAALTLVDAAARVLLLPEDEPHEAVDVGYLRLARHRVVAVFAGAMALGAGLGGVLESLLPLHLDRTLGMGPAAIGLAFTISAVASTFTSPMVGHLTDRHGPRGLVTGGLLLGAALMPLTAAAPSPLLVMLLLLFLGSAQSLIMSPTGPALSQAVERMGSRSYGSVFSLLNLAFALGMMAGPLAGSFLAVRLGLQPTLVLLAAVLVIYVLPVRRAARALAA